MTSPLPREHVRRPDLPWRVSALTECGRPVGELAHVIERPALLAKVHRDGIQRAAYTTCMTCLDTVRNRPDWDTDPVRALSREFYSTADPRFADELRAIAALVAAHRDEFDDYMAGLKETTRLDEARRNRRTRGA